MSDACFILHENLMTWLHDQGKRFEVYGPVRRMRDQVVFTRIEGDVSPAIPYDTTMLAPRQFIYPYRIVCGLRRDSGHQEHTG